MSVLTHTDSEAAVSKPLGGNWKVSASPDGSLVDKNSKKELSYLYYEAKRSTPYKLDIDKCFCIKGNECDEFLETALETLGLNFKESNDFIIYWLPLLEKNIFNLIRFLGDEFTNEVELDINPKPDTFIRIFMIFKGSDEFIDTHPEPLKHIERKGFVAVEWGGMNLDD